MIRITKTAKAFLDHFVLRNPKAYTPNFKQELAATYGMSVEELGVVCIKMADSVCSSTPLFSHLPPHEQRLIDVANAITIGMFASSEFLKFASPEKEKKN